MRIISCAIIILGLSCSLLYPIVGRRVMAFYPLTVVSPLPLVLDAPHGFEYWAPAQLEIEVDLFSGQKIYMKNPKLNFSWWLPHRLVMRELIPLVSFSYVLLRSSLCEGTLKKILGIEGRPRSFRIILSSPSSPAPAFHHWVRKISC